MQEMRIEFTSDIAPPVSNEGSGMHPDSGAVDEPCPAISVQEPCGNAEAFGAESDPTGVASADAPAEAGDDVPGHVVEGAGVADVPSDTGGDGPANAAADGDMDFPPGAAADAGDAPAVSGTGADMQDTQTADHPTACASGASADPLTASAPPLVPEVPGQQAEDHVVCSAQQRSVPDSSVYNNQKSKRKPRSRSESLQLVCSAVHSAQLCTVLQEITKKSWQWAIFSPS